MNWEFYIQAVLGVVFFSLSFGKRVKEIAIMELERDLKSGKKTPGYQAWTRRNLPTFYRMLGMALMGLALVQYLQATKIP